MATTTTNEITGLIIRLVDYKESSYIMHLLTASGIKSIICQGIKKPNSKLKGYILSYNYVKCFITNGKIPILTDILVIEAYDKIQNNFNKNKYAGLTINMLYKEQYENNKVYQLALKTIKFFNDFDEEYYYYTFLLKNLYFMGLGLDSKNYNKDEILGFNIYESNIVSKKDDSYIDINQANTLKIFELYYSKLEDNVDIDLRMLKDFLTKYYEVHASIKL